jgi:hypothetical protein
MLANAAIIAACIGAAVGLLGFGISLFNARKAVAWKRAELANNYLKDLITNEELVFACRALDWNGGFLVVPDALRPLLPNEAKIITHKPSVMQTAMKPDLTLDEMAKEPRLQLYRTSFDSLLSWLSLVDNALQRNLFEATDVRAVGYWVQQIHRNGTLDDFIEVFDYAEPMQRLRFVFGQAIPRKGGFGQTARVLGTGAGG